MLAPVRARQGGRRGYLDGKHSTAAAAALRMSGIKSPELMQFFRSFHARGLTVEILAEFAGRSRATVTRVLNGARRRGPVWEKIKSQLTPREIELLDVAHSSTWNTSHVANRPVWAHAVAKIKSAA